MELPITRPLVAALGRTTREVEVLCPPARLGEADDAFARLQRSLPIQEPSPLLRNPFVLAVLESRRAGAATPKWSWSEVLRSFNELLLYEAFLMLRLRAAIAPEAATNVIFYLTTTQAWLKALRPHRTHAAACIQRAVLSHLYRPGGAMMQRSVRELGFAVRSAQRSRRRP